MIQGASRSKSLNTFIIFFSEWMCFFKLFFLKPTFTQKKSSIVFVFYLHKTRIVFSFSGWDYFLSNCTNCKNKENTIFFTFFSVVKTTFFSS
jgi:hypothetical protein